MNLFLWYSINKYLLQTCFYILYRWILDNSEIKLIVEEEEFYNSFINMVYYEYYNNNIPIVYETEEQSTEYFELKYTSEITDMFIEFKNISNNYCSNIFFNKWNTSDCIINLIINNISDINIYNDIDNGEIEYINNTNY
tara:strand:+ start:1279 stop:1695 length:417 start_codon:yes stop_codon:yes gene_type:complete